MFFGSPSCCLNFCDAIPSKGVDIGTLPWWLFSPPTCAKQHIPKLRTVKKDVRNLRVRLAASKVKRLHPGSRNQSFEHRLVLRPPIFSKKVLGWGPHQNSSCVTRYFPVGCRSCPYFGQGLSAPPGAYPTQIWGGSHPSKTSPPPRDLQQSPVHQERDAPVRK